jgi:hypothetical protein
MAKLPRQAGASSYVFRLMHTAATATCASVVIEIGGMGIAVRTDDPKFRRMLEDRYFGFTGIRESFQCEFEVELFEPDDASSGDKDLRVTRRGDRWILERGDFRAWWEPRSKRGYVRQSRNPYAIDSVLRIVHTLILAERGGFLVHAASAIRGGRAFLFAGVSGAGKTTISRLAPPDVVLLTDEISYLHGDDHTYHAYGTPFAGELARAGENQSAPLKTLFLLEKGDENRIEEVGESHAVRMLLRNILFFAEDSGLVERIFQSACEFVRLVPVRRLIFAPDERVWDIIR